MSAINRGELLPLDIGFMGRPFVAITSSNTDPLPDLGFMGRPFQAAPTSSGGGGGTGSSGQKPVIFTVSG